MRLHGLTAEGYWEVSSDSLLTARVLHSFWRAPSPPATREQGLGPGYIAPTHIHNQLFQTNYGDYGDALASTWIGEGTFNSLLSPNPNLRHFTDLRFQHRNPHPFTF